MAERILMKEYKSLKEEKWVHIEVRALFCSYLRYYRVQ